MRSPSGLDTDGAILANRQDQIFRVQTLQNAVVKLQLQALQADSDHRTMEALVRERDEELEERTAEYNEGEHSEPRLSRFQSSDRRPLFDNAAKKAVKTLTARAKELVNEAEGARLEADQETQAGLEERREDGIKSLEVYEAEREDIVAKLDCMIAISPAVLEAYKKRKGEVSLPPPPAASFRFVAVDSRIGRGDRSLSSLRNWRKRRRIWKNRNNSSTTQRFVVLSITAHVSVFSTARFLVTVAMVPEAQVAGPGDQSTIHGFL